MFEQVFDTLNRATESSVKMQQEMVQKWFEAFSTAPTMPNLPAASDALTQWRKQWEEASGEMLKRQKQLVDQNFDAGIEALEKIFRLADSKSPPEFQEKVTELYRKSFQSLRQLSEAQMSEFKTAMQKWADLMARASK